MKNIKNILRSIERAKSKEEVSSILDPLLSEAKEAYQRGDSHLHQELNKTYATIVDYLGKHFFDTSPEGIKHYNSLVKDSLFEYIKDEMTISRGMTPISFNGRKKTFSENNLDSMESKRDKDFPYQSRFGIWEEE